MHMNLYQSSTTPIIYLLRGHLQLQSVGNQPFNHLGKKMVNIQWHVMVCVYTAKIKLELSVMFMSHAVELLYYRHPQDHTKCPN